MQRVWLGVVALVLGLVALWYLVPNSTSTGPQPSPQGQTRVPAKSGSGVGTAGSNGSSATAPKEAQPTPTPPIPVEQRAKPVYTPDPDDDRALVGLTFTGITDAERTRLKVPDRFGRGVIITKLHPDAPAVESGLAVDDVIVRARRTAVNNEQDLRTAVGDRSHTVLTVSRDGHLFHVVLHKPYIPKPANNPAN